jgi:hypothetical protein
LIYAIRAVGTQYVKLGRAGSVGKRLRELDTGCPHELHIEAVADWPDSHESSIHLFLADHCEKLEWFRDSPQTAQVIKWLQQGESGLREFLNAFIIEVRTQARKPLSPLRSSRVRETWRDQLDPLEKRRLERQEYWKQRSKAPQQSDLTTS